LRTRDIVFVAGFIPDLVNPRSMDISLYEMVMFTSKINYTLKCKSLRWNIGIRQLVPVELSPERNKETNTSPAALKQTIWGGTTLKTGIEYFLRKSH
jgi:hypothetical protein